MPRVKAPDGNVINFPDSMSNDEISMAMQRLYPPAADRPSTGFASKKRGFQGRGSAEQAAKKAAAQSVAFRQKSDRGYVDKATIGNAMIPFYGDIEAGAASLPTRIGNAVKRLQGQDPKFTGDQYQRQFKKQAQDLRRKEYERAPIKGTIQNIAGGAASAIIPISTSTKAVQGAKGLSAVAAAAKPVLAGGAIGAAYGAGQGDTLRERGQNALTGGATALALGAGLSGLAAGAGRVLKKRPLAARPATTTKKTIELTPTEIKALKILKKDLKSGGNEFLKNVIRNPRLTTAEAMGMRGKQRLRALANSDQFTQLTADYQAVFGGRKEEAAQNVLKAFERYTGVNPSQGASYLDDVITKGRAEAAPLYRKAYEEVTDTPKLRRMAATVPDIKTATKQASRLILAEGQPVARAIPERVMAEGLPTGKPVGDASGYLKALTEGAPRPVDGLSEFVAKNGGVKDFGGDIKYMGLGKTLVKLPVGQKRMIVRERGGRNLDDMANLAYEQGFYKERPSIEEFLDDLINDAFGRKKYSMDGGIEAAGEAAQKTQYIEGLAERIDELKATGNNKQKAQALADEDELIQFYSDWAEGKLESYNPATKEIFVPTTQQFDYVKRVLDDRINDAAAKGRNTELRSLTILKNDLVNEMVDANPRYKEALEAGEAYLKPQAAYERGKKQFFNPSTRVAEDAQYVSNLSKSEREADLRGLADELYQRIGRRDVPRDEILNALTSPNARAKLEARLGPKAKPLIRSLMRERELLGNARQMLGGSQTQGLQAAEKAIQGDFGNDVPSLTTGSLEAQAVSATLSKLNQMFQNYNIKKNAPAMELYFKLLMQDGLLTARMIKSLPPSAFKANLQRVQSLPRLTNKQKALAYQFSKRSAITGLPRLSGPGQSGMSQAAAQEEE